MQTFETIDFTNYVGQFVDGIIIKHDPSMKTKIGEQVWASYAEGSMQLLLSSRVSASVNAIKFSWYTNKHVYEHILNDILTPETRDRLLDMQHNLRTTLHLLLLSTIWNKIDYQYSLRPSKASRFLVSINDSNPDKWSGQRMVERITQPTTFLVGFFKNKIALSNAKHKSSNLEIFGENVLRVFQRFMFGSVKQALDIAKRWKFETLNDHEATQCSNIYETIMEDAIKQPTWWEVSTIPSTTQLAVATLSPLVDLSQDTYINSQVRVSGRGAVPEEVMINQQNQNYRLKQITGVNWKWEGDVFTIGHYQFNECKWVIKEPIEGSAQGIAILRNSKVQLICTEEKKSDTILDPPNLPVFSVKLSRYLQLFKEKSDTNTLDSLMKCNIVKEPTFPCLRIQVLTEWSSILNKFGDVKDLTWSLVKQDDDLAIFTIRNNTGEESKNKCHLVNDLSEGKITGGFAIKQDESYTLSYKPKKPNGLYWKLLLPESGDAPGWWKQTEEYERRYKPLFNQTPSMFSFYKADSKKKEGDIVNAILLKLRVRNSYKTRGKDMGQRNDIEINSADKEKEIEVGQSKLVVYDERQFIPTSIEFTENEWNSFNIDKTLDYNNYIRVEMNDVQINERSNRGVLSKPLCLYFVPDEYAEMRLPKLKTPGEEVKIEGVSSIFVTNATGNSEEFHLSDAVIPVVCPPLETEHEIHAKLIGNAPHNTTHDMHSACAAGVSGRPLVLSFKVEKGPKTKWLQSTIIRFTNYGNFQHRLRCMNINKGCILNSIITPVATDMKNYDVLQLLQSDGTFKYFSNSTDQTDPRSYCFTNLPPFVSFKQENTNWQVGSAIGTPFSKAVLMNVAKSPPADPRGSDIVDDQTISDGTPIGESVSLDAAALPFVLSGIIGAAAWWIPKLKNTSQTFPHNKARLRISLFHPTFLWHYNLVCQYMTLLFVLALHHSLRVSKDVMDQQSTTKDEQVLKALPFQLLETYKWYLSNHGGAGIVALYELSKHTYRTFIDDHADLLRTMLTEYNIEPTLKYDEEEIDSSKEETPYSYNYVDTNDAAVRTLFSFITG